MPSLNGQASGNDIHCGLVRYLFHLSYFAITIPVAVTMMVSGQVAAGASLLVASFIAWLGGAGARGRLYGDTGQKIVGLLLGIISLYFASLLANWGQAIVVLFDIGFPAPLWVLIGAAIGFVFTARKDAGI